MLAISSVQTQTANRPALDPGYQHFYNNEFDQALACFEEESKQHPDDPDNYDHVAQAVLYREMFRDGVLESQLVTLNNPFLRRPKMEISDADKQQFLAAVNKAIELSQRELSQNSQNVDALYALAVGHGLRSNYLFLVEKSWLEALREATAARKTCEKILRVDPHQVDALLILGLNRYIVGSLSFYMRALGFLNGFKGDRAQGLRDLETVWQQGTRNSYDAEILLAALYRREKTAQKALPLLENLVATFPRNYLFRFEEVQMYSDLGNKEAALRVVAEIRKLHDGGFPGYATIPEQKIDFTTGNLLFWYDDLEAGLQYLHRAAQNTSDLDLGTALLTWLRVGQTTDLLGQRDEAIQAYHEVIQMGPNTEIAVEAKGYIRSPYHRKVKIK